MAERFVPRTQSEIYESFIDNKRALVTAGITDWTTESPGDYGINILNLVSFELAQWEAWIDSRTKQASLPNAQHREPVMDGARNLAYRNTGPKPAVITVFATSSQATLISQGDRLIKTLEDNSDVYFEAVSDVVFSGAETKKFYAIEGSVKTREYTGTGEKWQKVYMSTSNVASSYFSITEEGDPVVWEQVTDFSGSNPTSRHFMVEFDYSFRPIIIFGDGVYGRKPRIDKTYSIAYRQCSGAIGNVPPGVLRLASPNSAITALENRSPIQATLASAVELTDTEIILVDDGSVASFSTAGVAYIGEDSDSFTYDGISGTTLQNVSGLSRYHAAGESVSYTVGQTYGADKANLNEVKLAALRENRYKLTPGSLLDLSYAATKVPGVARAGSFSVAHTQFVQVIPYHAGVPESDLLDSVSDYLNTRPNARHSIRVVSPSYAYVDVELEITPMPGRDWENEVYPKVLDVIRYFLSPLSRTTEGTGFISSWGRRLKKSELTYYLMYVLGGTYIQNIEYKAFKRSTEVSGTDDILLGDSEVANIGTMTITDSENPPSPSSISKEIGFS